MNFATNQQSNGVAAARAAAAARRPRGTSNGGSTNGGQAPPKKKKRRKNKKKNNSGGGGEGGSTGGQQHQHQHQQQQHHHQQHHQQQHQQQQQQQPSSASNGAKVETRTTSTTLNALSDSPFNALSVTSEIKRSMAEIFGYQNMTKVQAQSIPISLTGMDILAKAKTGTGKTIAFLIPAIHKIHTTTTPQQRTGNVSVLVISPTRELASQIEQEALGLTRFLPHLKVQCVYGGTNVKRYVPNDCVFSFLPANY